MERLNHERSKVQASHIYLAGYTVSAGLSIYVREISGMLQPMGWMPVGRPKTHHTALSSEVYGHVHQRQRLYIKPDMSPVYLHFQPCPGSTRSNAKGTVLYWASGAGASRRVERERALARCQQRSTNREGLARAPPHPNPSKSQHTHPGVQLDGLTARPLCPRRHIIAWPIKRHSIASMSVDKIEFNTRKRSSLART